MKPRPFVVYHHPINHNENIRKKKEKIQELRQTKKKKTKTPKKYTKETN